MSYQNQFQNQNNVYTYQNANYVNNNQMNQNYNYQSINVNANNYPNSNFNNNMNNQTYNVYNSNQNQYNQSQKNSSGYTQTVHKTTCTNCMKKFLNILLWIVFIAIFVCLIATSYALYVAILFAILYLIYLCVEFNSETFSFVRNIKYDVSMYNYMGELFQQHPYIIFCCELFHYENHHYINKDQHGKILNSHSETRKVVTRTNEYNMPYCSCKDVSGLFNLDYETAQHVNKPLVKLYLKNEINFADEISYSDYLKYKNDFWENNRYYDEYMNYWEKRGIDNFEEYNLICLDKRKKPPCLNCCVYVLCIFLMLGEVYKCYVDKFCFAQHYTIRKIISTRYNLIQDNYNDKYNNMTPMLNIYSQQYNYNYNQTGYYSSTYNVIAPTQQELNAAKAYNSYIPQYPTQNVGYSSYIVNDWVDMGNINYNSPPPDYMYPGDKPLPSNLIREKYQKEFQHINIINVQEPKPQQPSYQPIQQPIQQPVQQTVQKPVEQKPVQKPVEQKPVQKPVEQKPVEQKPVQKPVEQKPVQKPVEQPVQPVQQNKPTEINQNIINQPTVKESDLIDIKNQEALLFDDEPKNENQINIQNESNTKNEGGQKTNGNVISVPEIQTNQQTNLNVQLIEEEPKEEVQPIIQTNTTNTNNNRSRVKKGGKAAEVPNNIINEINENENQINIANAQADLF